ncbi:hypothetical protein [Sphingomonas crusticola]|uniref:hypothetical protein n=1 Tax=Sphingomonas crusticola TaxID=1697973 RepID=UPI0013C2E715|nr:hypothetical protein [Sphingomonas crusticola]
MRTPFIFALTLVLAGCGTEIAAPSLAPRAVEKQPIDMPVAHASEVESVADTALMNQIASLVAAAEAGDRAFADQRARADAAVRRAAGAAQGSEAWIVAQEALTSLDAARAPVRDAAAAIDALRQSPANAAPGNRAAIDEAAAQVTQLDRAESNVFATLAAKLG